MTIYDPYQDPNRAPTSIGTTGLTRPARHSPHAHPDAGEVSGPVPHTDPPGHPERAYGPARAPASRSPILTALVSFISLSIVPVTVILAVLIWINQELCQFGQVTIDCQDVDVTVRGLVATAGTGLGALVVSMIGGGRIKCVRNTAGLVLAVVAVAAMAILIAWLRQNLGIPFPW